MTCSTRPVERNGWGQRASFEAGLRTVVGGEANFHGVFIRAPRFSDEGSAQPIAWFEDEVVGGPGWVLHGIDVPPGTHG